MTEQIPTTLAGKGKNLKSRIAQTFVILAVIAGVFTLYKNSGIVSPANLDRDLQAEQASGKTWAQPLQLPGVENFHKVSDNLYRGHQPTEQGLAELKKLGIKTVINLRTLHSDREQIGNTQLDYERLKMKPWDPDDDEVIKFLRIVADTNSASVFVHCHYGADRTGTNVRHLPNRRTGLVKTAGYR